MLLFVCPDVVHVLVAASGEVDEQDRLLRQVRGALDRLGDGVARFERGDDALEAAEGVEGGDCLVVVDRRVLGAARVVEEAVFGSDAGVVESGGDRVGVDDIAVGRLEEQGLRAVEDAEAPAVDRRGVFARRKALPARLHADELHLRVVEEPGEEADRVRAAAHAGEASIKATPRHMHIPHTARLI